MTEYKENQEKDVVIERIDGDLLLHTDKIASV